MSPRELTQLFPPNAFYFGGGGQTQPVTAPPIVNTPAPAVSPPVTSTASEVVQAQQDARRQSLKKRGFSKTVRAGDTGGWSGAGAGSPTQPNATAGAPGTVKLGGG